MRSTSSPRASTGTGWPAGSSGWFRKLRAISFAPVGAYCPEQSADFGDVMASLGITGELDDFTQKIALVERDLLFAQQQGLSVPPYISRAFRESVELARVRAEAA